jgi:hypothetical protein
MTNKPSKPTVIQALLEAGAHFDTLNADKKAFYHMLKGQPLHEVRLPVVPMSRLGPWLRIRIQHLRIRIRILQINLNHL